MPIGVLNPGDLDHSTTTRPSPTLNAVGQRRWFSDGLHTEVKDQDLNSILGQIRHAIDFWSVTDVEGDDTLLRKAIQAGASTLSGNLKYFQELAGGVDRVPYWTSAAAMSTFVATAYSRSLLAKVTVEDWRLALNIGDTSSYLPLSGGTMTSAAFIRGGGPSGSYFKLYVNTIDGADSGALIIAGGGAAPDTSRGGYVAVYGNEYAALGGVVLINAGTNGTVRINNTPVSHFATGTDAANLSGTLSSSRIANGSLQLQKLEPIGTNYMLGNVSGATASPAAMSQAQVLTFLNITPGGLGLASIAVSGSASDLTTGTVPNARIAGSYTGFAAITMTSPLTMSGHALTQASVSPPTLNIAPRTANNGHTAILGGIAAPSANGGSVIVYGQSHTGNAGDVLIQAGNAGQIMFNGTPMSNFAVSTDLLYASGTLAPSRIAAGTIGLPKLADIGANRILGRADATLGEVMQLTPSDVSLLIGYDNTGLLTKILAVDGAGSGINADLVDGKHAVDLAWLDSSPVFTGAVTGGNFISISTDSAAGTAPQLILRRDSGTPTGGDMLGSVNFQGNNGSNALVQYAEVVAHIVSAASGTHDGYLYLRAANNGSINNVMTVGLGVIVGGPSGGHKGLGTLNAAAVYDDNNILTCLPLQQEFLAAGTVDLARWDAIAVSGRHAAAHKFVELLEQGVDPRDPMKFIAAMKRMQALPGMPTQDDWQHGSLSMGEIFNRLWLAVEMLAVAWMSHVEGERETRH